MSIGAFRFVPPRPHLVAVAILFCSVVARAAVAQGPQMLPPESVAPSWRQSTALLADHSATGILGSGAKDHRYTGMWVGLGTWGLLTGLSLIMCQGGEGGCNTDNLGFKLVGSAALLGGVGAMIGRAFPKQPSPVTEVSGSD